GEFLGSQVVRLSAGKNVFSYRQSLDASGIHVYQAAVEVDGDTIEDNTRAVGAVVVRGRPQVLLADRDRSHAQSLAGALRSQSIDVTVVEPPQIPTDLAGLQKYDGLILSNVSSLKLSRQQMGYIRDYVRDYGGGLVMIGGEESFGLGGYYRTPIEEALPVTMEVKQKVEIPSLAVVLSIDRSGSMVMADGQMTRGDFLGRLRRMSKDKITVSTVAIGKDADVQLMVDVAKWGKGRFYYTEDSQTIPRIFTLETQLASKASLVEQPFKPQLTSPGHEAIQEIDWKSVPPLGGDVATTLKSTADLVLMSHQEDPVLATWRYGLGRSVAFTSDAKAKWAVLWLRWREFNKFWSQLIRWTLRSGTRSDTVAIVDRRENTGEIFVDAVDPKGEFINFLD